MVLASYQTVSATWTLELPGDAEEERTSGRQEGKEVDVQVTKAE